MSIEATNARRPGGGQVNGDAGIFWGVGPDRNQPCATCCVTCANKTTAIVEIEP